MSAWLQLKFPAQIRDCDFVEGISSNIPAYVDFSRVATSFRHRVGYHFHTHGYELDLRLMIRFRDRLSLDYWVSGLQGS